MIGHSLSGEKLFVLAASENRQFSQCTELEKVRVEVDEVCFDLIIHFTFLSFVYYKGFKHLQEISLTINE